jgi:hypothetical protein
MRGLEKAGSWAAGVLIAVGCGLVATDAQAVRFDNIDVTVSPSTANVSYGAPGSYTFYIANYTNGAINSIRFRAYLSAGEFAETNPISAGASATCTRVSPQTIDCSIAGGIVSYGFSTFDFAFTSPAASTSAASVRLDWDVRFGQGEASNYISTTGTPGAAPTYISLIQNSDVEARAYIPPAGFNVYTGTAIPSAGDPFTVGLIVDPAANKVVTAGILENACSQPTRKCAQLEVLRKEVLTDGSLVYYKAVYTGDATTTDLDKRLVIVLRFAASEAGGSLSQLHVFYTPDPTLDDPIPTPILLSACPKRAPNYVPQVGEPPCVASKVEFTKRTAPDPSLIGVVQVELWASKNGYVDSGW